MDTGPPTLQLPFKPATATLTRHQGLPPPPQPLSRAIPTPLPPTPHLNSPAPHSSQQVQQTDRHIQTKTLDTAIITQQQQQHHQQQLQQQQQQR